MLTLIEGARLVVTQDDRRTRIPGGFVLVRDHLIEAVRTKTSATLEDDWTVLRLERLSR